MQAPGALAAGAWVSTGWTATALVLVLIGSFAVYDLVLPYARSQRMRNIVHASSAVGTKWAAAQPVLVSHGYNPTSTGSSTARGPYFGSTMYRLHLAGHKSWICPMLHDLGDWLNWEPLTMFGIRGTGFLFISVDSTGTVHEIIE